MEKFSGRESHADTMFFIDSTGRLLISHDKTDPGDQIIKVEGSNTPFTLLLTSKHFHTLQAQRYVDMDSVGLPDKSPRETRQTCLVLGVCSLYPGQSKYQVPETHWMSLVQNSRHNHLNIRPERSCNPSRLQLYIIVLCLCVWSPPCTL